MYLDGENLEIGEIVISDSNENFNKVSIYSKDHTYKLTFWTRQEYKKFNELELNKKTDIMNYIDDYDIDFCTDEYGTINSKNNTDIYFTRIDINKYILNVEINDFDNCVIGNMKNHKTLKLETIIDFNM